MAAGNDRDWTLVAPWWRWGSPTDPRRGRLTRPVFQKYESPTLVNDFLKDPQRCLKFVDDDVVHFARSTGAVPPDAVKTRLSEYEYVKDPLSTRKIFLDTHKRHYLVVCSIHCDAPGFPRAARNRICEVGFVVRRRTADLPPAALEPGAKVLQQLATAEMQTAELAGRAAEFAGLVGPSLSGAVAGAKGEAIARRRDSTRAVLAAAQTRFDEWVARFGVVPSLQGWFKSSNGHDKIGSWKTVDETPAELGLESTFPMYPLIPDRNDRSHAGHFGTIYFGVLPVGTGDTDDRGNARFDDDHVYEVRCYVIRHKGPHTSGTPCKCPDRMFWGPPTEPYQLAGHFDLIGTANRPVTVQLPSLHVLAAQAKPSLGLGFKKPVGSLIVKGDKDGKPAESSLSTKFEICFFSIPLITIVAMFVFELFLPVVVILFGLYFLLKLKFCIPPAVSVETQAALRLQIKDDLQTNLDLDLDASLDKPLNDDLVATFESPPDLASRLESAYSRGVLAQLDLDLADASAAVETGASASPNAPSLTANLQWEAEVKYV
jgi:hypothetical protein